jgi:predicted ArsR family transcriptional regulator
MERNSGTISDPPEQPVRPTRDRLVSILRAFPEGRTVAELASILGLQQNGVRKHLVVLSQRGLVAAARVPPSTVGRPPTRFRLADPDTRGHADRMLSTLLLDALGDIDPSAAERVAFNSKPTRPGAPSLDGTLSSLGFAPADITPASQRAEGGRTIELRACPYLELVGRPHGHLICAFHRGLVRRDMPAGAALEEFRVLPGGPRCRIVLATSPDDRREIP